MLQLRYFSLFLVMECFVHGPAPRSTWQSSLRLPLEHDIQQIHSVVFHTRRPVVQHFFRIGCGFCKEETETDLLHFALGGRERTPLLRVFLVIMELVWLQEWHMLHA